MFEIFVISDWMLNDCVRHDVLIVVISDWIFMLSVLSDCILMVLLISDMVWMIYIDLGFDFYDLFDSGLDL